MSLRKELAALLNMHCVENRTDTPDYILAEYMLDTLKAFDSAMDKRKLWYGVPKEDHPTFTTDQRR